MRRPIVIIFLAIIVAAVLTLGAGPLMSQVENPAYRVERAEGPIELRAYPSMIVATTVARGSRGSSVNQGFRILANYIFGDNVGGAKIAMTAPVMQERSGFSSAEKERAWTIRFVMPREWSKDSLPEPQNPRVTLDTIPAATFAVIRFSGFWRDALLQKKTNELQAYIARSKLTVSGSPIYAFYNPPWTLPFFRRNEVMIEVQAL